jgi:Protein of unknown function (DUF664)
VPDNKPPRFDSPERETLVVFLNYLRESVVRKLDGLSEHDARRVLVESGTSLLSLVDHLTAAEVSWFQLRFAATDSPRPADAVDEDSPVERHLTHYRIATERNDWVVASAKTLEQNCGDANYADLTLRWVLVHMIEETARHAGHADIIREQIDGVTGR